MNEKRMRRLLELHDGVGVITHDVEGNKNYYFYEKFNESESEIERAYKQLISLLEKGEIARIEFVSK